MSLAVDVEISSVAKEIIEKQIRKFKSVHDEVFGFAYISRFVNSDGATVPGFRPGYMGSPVVRPTRDNGWLLVRSADLSFYLCPHFNWDSQRRYRIDHVGGDFALLSIEPMD